MTQECCALELWGAGRCHLQHRSELASSLPVALSAFDVSIVDGGYVYSPAVSLASQDEPKVLEEFTAAHLLMPSVKLPDRKHSTNY